MVSDTHNEVRKRNREENYEHRKKKGLKVEVSHASVWITEKGVKWTVAHVNDVSDFSFLFEEICDTHSYLPAYY